MTIKQSGFVRDYLATGNATEAVRRNYDIKDQSTARSMASENLTKPNIRATILECLEKQGISNELVAIKIGELINAKKKVSISRNGKLEKVSESIDSHAIKAGLEFYLRLNELMGDPLLAAPLGYIYSSDLEKVRGK